eukprot:815803_1
MLTIFVYSLFVYTVTSQKATCDDEHNCNDYCRKKNEFEVLPAEYIPLSFDNLPSPEVGAPKCPNSISHYGPYKYTCQRVKYPTTPGFICGLNNHDGDPDAYVCYPTDKNLTNLPITSFVHGYGAGGNSEEGDYKGLFETWASWGIVTVAPESCVKGGCDHLFYDQETAILEAQQLGSSLHPIFSHVNFSKIGISGHSMGGFVSMATAGQWMNNYMYNNFTAKCAVLLHPGIMCPACQCNQMTIPSMWTTGTSDNIVSDSSVISCYDKEKNKGVYPKVIADLTGATHF